MSEIKPAATIMLIREKPEQSLEVLLLRRNKKLKFGPGFWVFPGGKLEDADRKLASDEEAAAKIAAVREAKEEANVDLLPKDLQYFCHWTTPAIEPRRFSTWFFYAIIQDPKLTITIDDNEIKEHLWISPKEALQRSNERSLMMMPPTYLALQRIHKCSNSKEIHIELSRFQPRVLPTISIKEQKIYCLYEGDVAFNGGAVDAPGARHRLVGAIDGNYEFIYENCLVPAVNGGQHI